MSAQSIDDSKGSAIGTDVMKYTKKIIHRSSGKGKKSEVKPMVKPLVKPLVKPKLVVKPVVKPKLVVKPVVKLVVKKNTRKATPVNPEPVVTKPINTSDPTKLTSWKTNWINI